MKRPDAAESKNLAITYEGLRQYCWKTRNVTSYSCVEKAWQTLSERSGRPPENGHRRAGDGYY